MRLLWHEDARLETDVAVAFYYDQNPALAQRFIDDLEDALCRLQRQPGAFRKVVENVRKCRLKHFPYGLIFRVMGDSIEIIAVMHIRRSPGYWKGRPGF